MEIDRESPADADGIRAAAVLLLLYPGPAGAATVPFMRRREDLRRHSGQIGLPGGAHDVDDTSMEATARREAFEELGIVPGDYEIVAAMPPVFARVSSFLVHPFVGVADTRPAFVPDEREVAELLEVPLDHLADRSLWREELWDLEGEPRRVHFVDFRGHAIWGLTARILDQFLESGVIGDARAAFERRVRDGRPLA